MIDYKCLFQFWRDDVHIKTDTVITIEEDILIDDAFEREETIRDILLEKLRIKYQDDIELIDYEVLTDRNYDIYKITY